MTAALPGIPEEELVAPGHRACAGCGCILAMRYVLKALGKNVIISMATGCMEVVTTLYPETSWRVPWIHSAFENAAATASGIAAGLKAMGREGVKSVAIAGDGGTADIGLQALSGAVERGDNFIFVCLPPDAEIVLENGFVIKIGDFVDGALQNGSVSNDGGVESAEANGAVLSWDGLNFSLGKITRVYRRPAPEKMIKIKTASGSCLMLTPEHKVLIDSSDGISWKRACDLKKGDRLFAPRKVDIDPKGFPSVFDLVLPVIGDRINVRVSYEVKAEIKKKLVEKHVTLKKAASALKLKKHQWVKRHEPITLSHLKEVCKAVGYNWHEICAKINSIGDKNFVLKEQKLTPDLMYLLGLIATDGSLHKPYSVSFVNANKYLLEEFRKAHERLFAGRKITETRIPGESAVRLTVSNPIIYALAKAMNIKSDPKEVLKLPNSLIVAFIKGCFDGDGCVSIIDHGYTKEARALISTVNETFSRRLRLMLQRLGIASAKLEGRRHDVIMYLPKDITRFMKVVGSKDPAKIAKFEELSQILRRRPRGHKFDLAPAACLKVLEKICVKQGTSPTSVDRNLTQIISGGRGATKQKVKELMEKLPISDDDLLLNELKRLTSDNFYMDEVKKIEEVKAESCYVYDITVDKTHVFVPEGAFVVSNCYDNEAYQNTGIQRSGATPFGAWTTTTPIGKVKRGEDRPKKDIPAIIAAHGAPYVATASVAYPLDFIKKLKKAAAIEGPTYIHVHAPCTPGWRIENNKTIEVARLAVLTGAWVLYEIEDGEFKLTFKPPKRRPVAEYLKLQGRFRHLTDEEIAEIQRMADEQCRRFGIE